jgi:hypothetical protein
MDSPIIATLPAGHRMDRLFGVLYDRPPAVADELTQIEGIRPLEAAALNEKGVCCFGQIALWRHREMSSFSSELQIPLARLIDEAWVAQARDLCRQKTLAAHSDFPRTFFRSLTVIVCALLAGWLVVWMIGQGKNRPLTGVLAADITSIRVPVSSRLDKVHVRAGDEVFSGQPLMTVENTEQQPQIEDCQRQLQEAERELKRLEAQAAIDAEWRRRDLDADIAGVREHLAFLEAPVSRTRTGTRSALRTRGVPTTQVSLQSSVPKRSLEPGPSQILFFNGDKSTAADSNTSTATQTLPLTNSDSEIPVRLIAAPVDDLSQAVTTSPGSVPTQPANLVEDPEKLRAELTRLEEVRSGLPTRIEDALGVSAIRERCSELAEKLQTLQATSTEITLASPVYGIVGQVRGRTGDQLQSTDVVLRILHTDRRSVVVQLPTTRVHEMSVGQEVELRFPGNQIYRGQVVEVPLMADASTESRETTTVVRVEPLGKIWPSVPIGCQVDVISNR